MTEEFTIQCESCGTIYSHLEEVCPYCGQPQPGLLDDDLPFEETYYDDLPPEGDLPPDQNDLLPDDDYAQYPADVSPATGSLAPIDEVDGEDQYLGPVDDPLADDDIFAVAEEEWPATYDRYDELYDEYDEPYDRYDVPDDYDEFELDEPEVNPRRFTRRRLVLGCLGLFLCLGLFYGGIGLLGAYHGLQERVQLTQTEAELHYQKGQEHLANNSLELAIAEFELALRLNPNFLAAREALREAQRISLSQPTPTSETRSAAAASVLATAETQMAQESWAEATETLLQVRELDSDYQAAHVSELLYQANYELGLQLTSPDQIEEAVLAFERALAERPDDTQVTVQLARALLYLEGKDAAQNDYEKAAKAFSQLYREDDSYLDVKQRLFQAYEAFGDELLDQEAWCLAEAQYAEAIRLQSEAVVQAKAETSNKRCQESALAQATGSPPRPQATGTPATNSPASSLDTGADAPITATTSVEPATPGGGSILFSAFNPNESYWEILSVPVRGGSPRVLATSGIMPSVSPNGRLLIYHSNLIEAEGFHLLDLTSGEDSRITQLGYHILPRWGGDNNQFLFVAQDPATNRWQIHLGFADGKGEPLILRDGRTPDWSPDNSLIACQGTDAQGNNPGIYIVPFNGGEVTRLTNHESDRMPKFSPDGSQLAFMSTRNGNWDIYTVSVQGSAPRQITTAPGNDGLPVWSPDGSQIAYVSDAGGSWAIYVINAAGGKPARVIEWDGSNRSDWLLAQIWWAR